MGKVLAINYSQSGQLDQIFDQLLSVFDKDSVERVSVKPKHPYPFPWSTGTFFDQMPETVLEEKVEIEPLIFQENKYDLIIFGYQPWFLSPSRPALSALLDSNFQSILKDTPIVTVIGGRNMWLNAQESVKNHIRIAGGRLVGNIPFVDRHANIPSAFSILHWMLSGKKEKKWNIFPLPGVSEKDISKADVFGTILLERWKQNHYEKMQKEILMQGFIYIPTDILFIEARAKVLFKAWANLIKRKGTTPEKRVFWVNAYKYYLLVALFIVAPAVIGIYSLFFAPFLQKGINKKKEYFCTIE